MFRQVLRVLFGLAVGGAATVSHAVSIKDLPDIVSISVFEQSASSSTEHLFLIGDPRLTTVLADPLGAGNRDFIGTTFGADENYDVFFSNADGTFNADGGFLSITADYDFSNDSGLNIDAVRLNFSSGPGELASIVASFVALSSRTVPFGVNTSQAIDGINDLSSALGDTLGFSERLRLTLGFESTSVQPVPIPAALPLFATALAGVGFFGWRRRRSAAA